MNFLKAFNSPFISPKIRFYFGKIKYGTPIFYPRRWIRNKENGYMKATPKKIGFDFVDLGYKTKWSATDYRFEWSPIWSFVFFKWQLCVLFDVPHTSNYWEAWLYYENDTDKSKSQEEKNAAMYQRISTDLYALFKKWTENDRLLSINIKENMKGLSLPQSIIYFGWNYDGWLTGGAARVIAGMEEGPINDYDILIPFHKWGEACRAIPTGTPSNKFGGFRLNRDGIEIDIWAGDIGWFLTNCKVQGKPNVAVHIKSSIILKAYEHGTNNH